MPNRCLAGRVRAVRYVPTTSMRAPVVLGSYLLAVGARAVAIANLAPPQGSPKVTAVVLNWARLHNVINIVKTSLCSHELDAIVDTVVIWNNNPRYDLTRHHFASAPCAWTSKLKIVNSKANEYFLARFLACAAATTQYCFIQDDDYLVLPRSIHTLHDYIQSNTNISSVHLLPPHEYLTTTLRTITSLDGTIHTGFAWLGHGTIMRSSTAVDFIGLLAQLNLTPTEMLMADNYFTVLSNTYPQVLEDIGIPLDGTGAFTVGVAGDERNWFHINRALYYLKMSLRASTNPSRCCAQHLLVGTFRNLYNPWYAPGSNEASNDATCTQPCSLAQSNAYLNSERWLTPPQPLLETRAICTNQRCMLRTNINQWPEFPLPSHPYNLRDHETYRRAALGDRFTQSYVENSLAAAADDSAMTAFRSVQGAKRGDYITLDMILLTEVPSQLAVLVDTDTAQVLMNVTTEVSQDEMQWVPVGRTFSCPVKEKASAGSVIECQLYNSLTNWRFVRLTVRADSNRLWTVFDMFIRFAEA
ncbi:hypothetical protein BKA62DRAFT_691182, partial [Auriculariales sp. MPI-PUGE-AT-0066]